MSTFIYALIDPTTQQCRYVGKTVNPEKRYHSHCNTRSKTYVSRWINKLKSEDRYPEMYVLERGLSNNEWPEAEQFWIAYFRFLGANLTNITAGGHHVVKVKANVGSDYYQIPDFDNIINRLCSQAVAKRLAPPLYEDYCRMVKKASKMDDGLFVYAQNETTRFLAHTGLLASTVLFGVKCFLVTKSDRYAHTMLVDTDIMRPVSTQCREPEWWRSRPAAQEPPK